MSTKKWILLLAAITCMQLAASAQRFEQVTIKYYAKSSQLVMSEGGVDSQLVVDPVTGDVILKTRTQRDVLPVSVDGKKVYAANEVTTPPQFVGKSTLEEYMVTKLKKRIESEQQPDGTLHVNLGHAIIDEKGMMVYYKYDGGRWQAMEGTKPDRHVIDPGSSILFALNEAAPWIPATLNGENVCAYIHLSNCDYHFDIRDHKVIYKKD